MKIGFYILGKKGYGGLTEFVNKFKSNSVAFVLGARDVAIDNDWYSEICQFCENNGIKFLDRNQADDNLAVESDYDFAIGWRWIIKDASRLIVFHDSLLPKYRGFAPLVNMLIDGVDEIGVTALLASDEYDKGDIVFQEKKGINYPIKISDAIDEITPLYTRLVVKTAQEILTKGTLKCTPQIDENASYSLWRDEKDYSIQWNQDSESINRFVDAIGTPYRGATSLLNGTLVRIFDAIPVPDVIVENRARCIGKIIFVHDGRPVVVCGSGLIKLIDLRAENGKTVIGTIPFRSRFESIK